MEGKFLFLRVYIRRVKFRERINFLEEKLVIYYCELRGDML